MPSHPAATGVCTGSEELRVLSPHALETGTASGWTRTLAWRWPREEQAPEKAVTHQQALSPVTKQPALVPDTLFSQSPCPPLPVPWAPRVHSVPADPLPEQGKPVPPRTEALGRPRPLAPHLAAGRAQGRQARGSRLLPLCFLGQVQPSLSPEPVGWIGWLSPSQVCAASQCHTHSPCCHSSQDPVLTTSRGTDSLASGPLQSGGEMLTAVSGSEKTSPLQLPLKH